MFSKGLAFLGLSTVKEDMGEKKAADDAIQQAAEAKAASDATTTAALVTDGKPASETAEEKAARLSAAADAAAAALAAAEAEEKTALARQIEMRERVAAAHTAVDAALSAPSYIDARTLHTSILERRFQYNFENAKLSLTFETNPSARIKLNVFRKARLTREQMQWLQDLQYEANVKQGEVSDEDLRALCNAAYTLLKQSALEEISARLLCTAGESVYAAQQALLQHPPEGLIPWHVDAHLGTLPPLMHDASPESCTDYPFSFGLRMRRTDGPGSQSCVHFFCLANDKCRSARRVIVIDTNDPPPPPLKSLYKGTIGLVPAPKEQQSVRTLIERHLQEEHWNTLLATGWASTVHEGPLGSQSKNHSDFLSCPRSPSSPSAIHFGEDTMPREAGGWAGAAVPGSARGRVEFKETEDHSEGKEGSGEWGRGGSRGDYKAYGYVEAEGGSKEGYKEDNAWERDREEGERSKGEGWEEGSRQRGEDKRAYMGGDQDKTGTAAGPDSPTPTTPVHASSKTLPHTHTHPHPHPSPLSPSTSPTLTRREFAKIPGHRTLASLAPDDRAREAARIARELEMEKATYERQREEANEAARLVTAKEKYQEKMIKREVVRLAKLAKLEAELEEASKASGEYVAPEKQPRVRVGYNVTAGRPSHSVPRGYK